MGGIFFVPYMGFLCFCFCFQLGLERKRLEDGMWTLRTELASQGPGPDADTEKCLHCSVQLSGFLIVPAADGCFPQGMDQKLLGASSISVLLTVGNRDLASFSLGP